MFEGLRTALKVVFASLSLDSLFVICCVLWALLVLWCVLSLLFNNYRCTYKNCLNIINFLQKEGLNRDNYSRFSSVWSKFPIAMRFRWKQYEESRSGKASDYLSQEECIDLQLNGGIFKHCRSVMRTTIIIATSLVALFSFALIGNTATSSISTVELTNSTIVDALILPLLFYIFAMVIYYIYTALRQLEYKTLVDTFYDLVDYLDEKVDMEDVFGKASNSVNLVSSTYTNETLQNIVDKKKKVRKRELSIESVKVGKNQPSNLNNGVLGKEDVEDKTDENVVKSYEKMTTKLSQKDEPIVKTGDSSGKIKSEAQFVEVISEVEDLVDSIEKERNKSKRTELEKTVNKKIKELTEFKQKAKSQKESVAVKKPTKNK